MMFNVLVDSGFWIALLNPENNVTLSERANAILEEIENEKIILPFPTLYEFVNSKLSRHKNKLARDEFERILNTANVEKIYDTDYRDNALKSFFENAKYGFKDVSLVDEILKLIIQDVNIKIDFIATFDSGLSNFAIANKIRVF